MINEDLRVRYAEFDEKIAKLHKQVALYQEVYHDIDISAMHE